MPFKKGYKHTELTKKKIGLANSIALKGSIPWNKGLKLGKNLKHSEKMKELVKQGIINFYKFPILKGEFNPMFGKHHSKESKIKMREANKEEKSYLWKGGIASGENKSGYYRFKAMERVARKKNAYGSHTLRDWQTLKAQYNWTCPCCKKQEPKVILGEDHIVPLSKGGSDNIENIQPLCRSCNSKKYTKIIKYEYELVEVKTSPLAEL